MVPGTLASPALLLCSASFLTGGRVGFCLKSVVNPPPWIMSGRIQLYITTDALGAEAHDAFKHWDLGDIVGARGTLFKTKTGELTVKVTELRLLAKALRPLPEKFHGLTDQEQK